jgi:hypothetical protein
MPIRNSLDYLNIKWETNTNRLVFFDNRATTSLDKVFTRVCNTHPEFSGGMRYHIMKDDMITPYHKLSDENNIWILFSNQNPSIGSIQIQLPYLNETITVKYNPVTKTITYNNSKSYHVKLCKVSSELSIEDTQ